MDKQHIDNYAKIPQPPRESARFMTELRERAELCFPAGRGCDPGRMRDALANGIRLDIGFPQAEDFPATAFDSLRRILAAKGIREAADGFPARFVRDVTLEREEYLVEIAPEGIRVAASDGDGLRRGVYFLEDRLREAEGAAAMPGRWRRRPFVKHRISRCFFGPTTRPPFFIDELTNDIDYYPEEYLNRLAHEGVNGLWLTMYFQDLPSSLFPQHGAQAEIRFAKLRKTVERCARYGIRIYVFLSEPKLISSYRYHIHPEEAAAYPGLNQSGYTCLSSEAGKQYIRESVRRIFEAVPRLGGIINIMQGEDNGSCVAYHNAVGGWNTWKCPLCAQRDDVDIFLETAQIFAEEIHRVNPDAAYIGWFYTPTQRDDGEYSQRLRRIARRWPDNATIMFNFESGARAIQLGKMRIVFDYSLAFVGPSELFADACRHAKHVGAKLQVGCSHEDASVPFMPVPENLYDKYRFMAANHVDAAMQCWYFGNYPGLMNKAAGELSFEPFPAEPMAFLEELARPEWRADAPAVAKAWHLFSMAYREFPMNIQFEWYGPLHNAIAWPLHLFPVDEPISPTWLLKHFPEVSGDRVGECLGYHHTLPEALELSRRMERLWDEGLAELLPLRNSYPNDEERLKDIGLAEAVGLQIRSAVNVLEFYRLREELLYLRKDNLAAMAELVRKEIANTRRMRELCLADSRLGYHSEAEGYLFFPEKLEARVALLEELLEKDFPAFNLDAAWIDEFTGKVPTGLAARCARAGQPAERHPIEGGLVWSACHDAESIQFLFENTAGKHFTAELEPCRGWMPVRVEVCRGLTGTYDRQHPAMPDIAFDVKENSVRMTIPKSLFEGFHREGFPMRFNVHEMDDAKASWAPGELFPSRLTHTDFNPAKTGWLVFD